MIKKIIEIYSGTKHFFYHNLISLKTVFSYIEIFSIKILEGYIYKSLNSKNL